MYIKKMQEIIDFFQKFAVLSFLIHIFSILNLFKLLNVVMEIENALG